MPTLTHVRSWGVKRTSVTQDDRQFGASGFRQYSSLAVPKLFKPPSELIQLPLFGQCGCLVPSRLLAT